MSKSKKAKKADNQENSEQVEVQEVGDSEDHIPPTIVDAGGEEVLPNKEPTQEIATEQPKEKPASKPRVNKRPYIADVEALLNVGSHTKQEILAFILEKYPAVSKGGASTFLTDLMNAKYRHWKDRAVIKLGDGKLQFEDMVRAAIETTEPEGQPTDEPLDATAE